MHFTFLFLYCYFSFEQALQKVDPSVFIPYWDCALDCPLNEFPADSAVWTADFWGSSDGAGFLNQVDNGPFANWVAPNHCQVLNATDLRRSTTNNKLSLYSKDIIQTVLHPATYADLMLLRAENTPSAFETAHGGPHNFVGGHMALIPCAPLDPVFWMHHSFVDCLWQEWVDDGNDNTYPELTDPGVTETKLGINPDDQMKDALMKPAVFMGNIKNIDGFRDNFYPGYLQRPSKIHCSEDADCHRAGDLQLLWCNTCTNCCVAKIKEGGRCDDFIGKDMACYCRDAVMTPKCQPDVVGATCVCISNLVNSH